MDKSGSVSSAYCCTDLDLASTCVSFVNVWKKTHPSLLFLNTAFCRMHNDEVMDLFFGYVRLLTVVRQWRNKVNIWGPSCKPTANRFGFLYGLLRVLFLQFSWDDEIIFWRSCVFALIICNVSLSQANTCDNDINNLWSWGIKQLVIMRNWRKLYDPGPFWASIVRVILVRNVMLSIFPHNVMPAWY